MLTTIEAIKILHLPSGFSNQEIENAYLKMIRRFPPEVFPEKATMIRKAYNALMLTDEYLYELLNESDGDCDNKSNDNSSSNRDDNDCYVENDLSFLTPYLP
ncbi:MAG: hypothetical protein HQK51_00890 [Oligoflexia bacterium]|nr:hypothetical protein [Oligoflexia bacterium]